MSNNRFKQLFVKADEAFDHKYASELKQLKALTEDELKAITPDGNTNEVYQLLVATIEEAAKKNLLRSEVIKRIQAMGESAVNIAEKVSEFKELL